MKPTLTLLITLLLALPAWLRPAEFYVAPTGNDANPGTKAQPFATLERARDAARKLRIQSSKLRIEIVVRGGTYELRQTLQLGAADSGTQDAPVLWRAYPGEEPILTGGAKITKFVPHQGETLKTDVRAQGFTQPLRQLFFDDRRQEMARYPNLNPAKPFETGWAFTDQEPVKPDTPKRVLRCAAADARNWARPAEGEVCIFPSHEWWMPDRWSWHIRPSASDHAALTTDSPHGGSACLRIVGKPDPANQDKESWARIPSVKSIEVPVKPGQVYRLTAWLRAGQPSTRVEIGLQAYRPNLYSWQSVKTVSAGAEWAQHELIARFPAQPVEMKSLYVRIRLPDGDGAVRVDDIELRAAEAMDEWAAWQALGMDRHSVIADPLFVDPAKDNYRLQPDSPAFHLGFQPIPVEQIGCSRDQIITESWLQNHPGK